MRILRLRSYYEPEVIASAHLINDMDNAFAADGITCVNYTPTPTRGVSDEVRQEYKKKKYEETRNGHIITYRFAMFREGSNPLLRALRYLLCNVVEYIKGINAKNIDLVYSSSTPPTQGMLCALVAKKLSGKYKKKVPFVYNLQDIFPDSLVTTGMTSKGSVIWKIGRKIEDFTYNNADKIIVISDSFKENIMAKGVPEEKIEVISNWIDADEVQPVAKADNRLFEEFGLSRDKFTVVYAGNFGAAQGADVVLKAAEILKDKSDIQFAIFGGGAEFESAETFVKEKSLSNVMITGLLPQERVPEVYSLGDVALITCKKGVGESGMPSKTWSIMACNTPVIASFDTDSELAYILEKAKAGVCVEPGDAQALATAISDAESNGTGECNSREYVINNADRKICVAKYVDVIRSFEK